jgi:hypothetical protein
MISLLVSLLILCLIFGVAWWVLSLIPMPPPFKTVAQVVIAIIFLLVLIAWLAPSIGGPEVWHWRR